MHLNREGDAIQKALHDKQGSQTMHSSPCILLPFNHDIDQYSEIHHREKYKGEIKERSGKKKKKKEKERQIMQCIKLYDMGSRITEILEQRL